MGIWDATLAFVLAGHGVEVALAVTATLLLRALLTLPLGLLGVISYAYLMHRRPVAARALTPRGTWEAIEKPGQITT